MGAQSWRGLSRRRLFSPRLVEGGGDASYGIGLAARSDIVLGSGIFVKNVARPGCVDGCLRITVGTAAENERCVSVLREELARLSGA
jgi:hypothetical protein